MTGEQDSPEAGRPSETSASLALAQRLPRIQFGSRKQAQERQNQNSPILPPIFASAPPER